MYNRLYALKVHERTCERGARLRHARKRELLGQSSIIEEESLLCDNNCSNRATRFLRVRKPTAIEIWRANHTGMSFWKRLGSHVQSALASPAKASNYLMMLFPCRIDPLQSLYNLYPAADRASLEQGKGSYHLPYPTPEF
jgi:hypothetical protein